MLPPLPEKQSLEERLKSFPETADVLQQPVTIHWNRHAIPFIEAQSDADLAAALGMVHAHLRLPQMEIFRRISQGRLSEMAGPLGFRIDRLLRMIDFGAASEASYQQLPPDTKLWLDRFTEGINHIQRHAPRSHTCLMLGIQKEPWTPQEILTIGRLAGTDVNWLQWAMLFSLDKQYQQEFIERFENISNASLASFIDSEAGEIFSGLSRSGSNSIAIAPKRSRHGYALLANDPHVGIFLPNFWMLVGIKSPSYHAVGFMVPSLPFLGIGRNPDIAWGGTNMRSQSSYLYTPAPDAGFTEHTESVKTRWWWDREFSWRALGHDPILSDHPMFASEQTVALHWLGHDVSDEITAFLKANRAEDFASFREAFRTYHLSGQNMLYADSRGNIGQIMAVALPENPPETLIAPERPDTSRLRNATTLPYALNPKSGYLLSSNNRPANSPNGVSRFFSPNDRIVRLTELVRQHTPLELESLQTIQQDTYSPSSHHIAQQWADALQHSPPLATPWYPPMLKTLAQWDGHYERESRGALLFQMILYHFIQHYYTAHYDESTAEKILGSGYANELVLQVLSDDRSVWIDSLQTALSDGFFDAQKHDKWGDLHRLNAGHLLSRIPLIGGRYRFADLPYSGSNETVHKSAHSIQNQPHDTRYGANAAHISLMHDMDENYFLLLGGNDGRLESENFLDLLDSWMERRYLKIPLSLEKIQNEFEFHITITPPQG